MRAIVLLIVAIGGYVIPRELAVEQALADWFKGTFLSGYEPLAMFSAYSLLLVGVASGTNVKNITLKWGDLDGEAVKRIKERLSVMDDIDPQKLLAKLSAIKGIHATIPDVKASATKLQQVIDSIQPIVDLDVEDLVDKANGLRQGLVAVSNLDFNGTSGVNWDITLKGATDAFESIKSMAEDFDLDEIQEQAAALSKAVEEVRKLTKNV